MNHLIQEISASFISAVLENFIIYQYFSTLLQKKDLTEIFARKISTIFVGVIFLTVSTEFFFPTIITISITITTLSIYSILFYGKIKTKALLILTYISLAATSEQLALLITSIFQFLDHHEHIERFFIIILSSIILVILIEILSKYFFKNRRILFFENRNFYILTPLFSIVLSLILFFKLVSVQFYLLALISLLGINICFFAMINRISSSLDTKNKLEQRELELSYQRNIAESNLLLHNEFRIKTHDINKHLVLIRALINNGQTAEAVKRLDIYLDSVNHSFSKININHLPIDSMIQYCVDNAKKHSVHVDFTVELQNKDFAIDDIDISVLLGNLFDNAIEAAEKVAITNDKKVHVEISTNHKQLVIEIHNSYVGTIDLNKTSKADKSQHGFGLVLIKQIVNKYGGTYFVIA